MNNPLNMLLNKDCIEVLKELPPESVDLLLTDPPYKLTSGGRTGKNTPRGGFFKDDSVMNTGKIFTENTINFSDWVPLLDRVMKPKTHLYVFCNGRNLKDLLVQMDKHFSYKNILVWDKGTVTPNRNYMQGIEFIVLYGKGPCRGINNMGEVNLLKWKNKFSPKVHPTQKPVELLQFLIENSSSPSETVLDPFMGSGSTCLAAQSLNRNFIGVEKDESYFNIAKQRLGL